MKTYIKPILIAVIYIIMQAIAGIALIPVCAVFNPALGEAIASGDAAAATAAIPASWLAISVMLSGVATVIAASLMKLISWKTAFRIDGKQASEAWLPILAAITGIVAITVFEEQLQLEDILKQEFSGMMHSTVGIIAISLIAPIIEELCFREGIMGGLLRRGAKPWVAIAVSAAIFGLIHGNPVQIVGAGLMGVIFGIIYYKSGNIVLTTLLHVLNNSLATVLTLTYGMNASFSDFVGGTTVAIISGILCAVFSVAMFVRYWKLD